MNAYFFREARGCTRWVDSPVPGLPKGSPDHSPYHLCECSATSEAHAQCVSGKLLSCAIYSYIPVYGAIVPFFTELAAYGRCAFGLAFATGVRLAMTLSSFTLQVSIPVHVVKHCKHPEARVWHTRGMQH